MISVNLIKIIFLIKYELNVKMDMVKLYEIIENTLIKYVYQLAHFKDYKYVNTFFILLSTWKRHNAINRAKKFKENFDCNITIT